LAAIGADTDSNGRKSQPAVRARHLIADGDDMLKEASGQAREQAGIEESFWKID
jgi:hypothetical protein